MCLLIWVYDIKTIVCLMHVNFMTPTSDNISLVKESWRRSYLGCSYWHILCLQSSKKSTWIINNSKDNCRLFHSKLSIVIWLLLWLHYVFPFPMLMSVHPGTWGGSCIESVTIFIERYKRQTDSRRAREQLFVLLIARNKSCGSSNKRWLLCDIFPYSWA